MSSSIYRFTLDLHSTQSQVSLPVTLGDTARVFLISLSDGGLPFTIEEGSLAMLSVKRPNETKFETFCAIENGTTIKYDFEQNTNTAIVAGITECAITLYDPENKKIASPRFTMIVSETVANFDDITEEEKTIIDQIVEAEAGRVAAENERVAAENIRKDALKNIKTESIVIGAGEAAQYSIAGGTTDKSFIQELAESQYGSLGGWASSFITLEPSKAEAAFSISLGANNTSSASGAITYGFGNKGAGWSSVALGASNETTGAVSLAYGYKNKATGDFGVALGDETVAGEIAFAGGVKSQATKRGSFAFGNECKATGEYAVSIGADNTAKGNRSFACGSNTRTEANYAHAEGNQTKALGHASHAEGELTEAKHYAHAEGYGTKAHGDHSHAEGSTTRAFGVSTHAEGWNTQAGDYTGSGDDITYTGEGAHAEGYMSIASGEASHAEGSAFYIEERKVWVNPTVAEGFASHAEGMGTTASEEASHAEGQRTTASGKGSHAGGCGTIASADYQTAIGTYNEEDADALLIVGNGTADNNRSNAFKVKKDGTGYLGGEKIATEAWVNNIKSEIWTFTLDTGETVTKEVFLK